MDAFFLHADGLKKNPDENPIPIIKSEKIRVAGIILAAGCSSRMGRAKQLLPFKGKTLLDQVIFNARASALDSVLVVLGHGATAIRKQVDLTLVDVVENSDYALGQSSSLKKGLAAVMDRCEGAMFLLGDQPLVGSETIDTLIQTFRRALPPILIPFCKGKRGNPVVIHQTLFPLLDTLTGDTGARGLFDRYNESIMVVDIEDTGILFDVDTLDDFQKLQNLTNKS